MTNAFYVLFQVTHNNPVKQVQLLFLLYKQRSEKLGNLLRSQGFTLQGHFLTLMAIFLTTISYSLTMWLEHINESQSSKPL